MVIVYGYVIPEGLFLLMYKCPIREDFAHFIKPKNNSIHPLEMDDGRTEPILLQGHLLLFDIGILHFVALRLFFVCLASSRWKFSQNTRSVESAGHAKTCKKSHTTTIYHFINGGFWHFSKSTLVTNDSISNVFMNTWVLQHPSGQVVKVEGDNFASSAGCTVSSSFGCTNVIILILILLLLLLLLVGNLAFFTALPAFCLKWGRNTSGRFQPVFQDFPAARGKNTHNH